MQHHQDWSIQVLTNPVFGQIAPLVTVAVVSAVFYFSLSHLRQLNFDRLVYILNQILVMVLDSLGISLPWLWGGPQKGSTSTSSRTKSHRRKSSSGKVVKPRPEQIPLQKASKESAHAKPPKDPVSDTDDVHHYPGLVNISGTYCFMNSTLQAMASLSYLQPHIDSIHARAEALDVPTPVIDALKELFRNLNTPRSSYHSLRPHKIIHALSSPPPHDPSSGSSRPRTSSTLFNSREHQDAQELFQLVSECVKNEMAAVEKEGFRDRGIAGVLDLERPKSTDGQDTGKEAKKAGNKSVFDGLTANRRSCVMCGYTEAVMHFGFDNWQLALPRLATSCRLEDCLEDYTRLEILKDCICRKCSILATHKRLLADLKTLEEALAPSTIIPSTQIALDNSTTSSNILPSSPPKTKPSQTKRKKHKEAKKMEQRIRTAIEEGRIEDETLLEGVKLEKVVSPASTKQAMIARPPQVLVLHLNRSMHYGQYAAKNSIRVFFPEVLDLTPFTTSGSLSTVPTSAISTPSPLPPTSAFEEEVLEQPRRPSTPTQETYSVAAQRTIYRLAAVVCHYGQHSFGHYICFRRKPRRRPKGDWVPPTLVDPLRMDELSLDMELDRGVEGDIETETDEHGTLRIKRGSKQNGSAKSRPSVVDDFGADGGSPRYYWEDHTEVEAGTNKGWLRISDDSVEECGIETVISEASAVFMLYYEKAVHPGVGLYSYHESQSSDTRSSRSSQIPNGIGRSERSRSRSRTRMNGSVTESEEGDADADAFSIGSEETLKPQLKVMDLNGSVGSLISEVGVGVLKREKSKGKERGHTRHKEKEREPENDRLSMSLYTPSSSPTSSQSVGARIIRNVTAGRQKFLSNGNGHGFHLHSSSSSDIGSPTPSLDSLLTLSSKPHSMKDRVDESIPQDMIASAPSILHSMNSSSSSKSTSISLSRGVGSKSTKIIHHPPLTSSGFKVKAQ